MIRTVSLSYAGEPGQQTDFQRGAQPDGMAVLLEDGTTIFIGERDGYGPATVWVMDPDGADVGSLPLRERTASGAALLVASVAAETESEQRMAHGDR